MKTTDRNYDLKEGFVWIIFEEKKESYTLQACLKELAKCKDEITRYNLIKNEKNIYKKAIDKNDDGMDWGACGDANSKAFEKFGENVCGKFFRKEIKNIGIRIE